MFSPPFALQVLLRCFSAGSPRLQRLVLAILASFAGRLDARVLDGCVRSVWPPAIVHSWAQVGAALVGGWMPSVHPPSTRPDYGVVVCCAYMCVKQYCA